MNATMRPSVGATASVRTQSVPSYVIVTKATPTHPEILPDVLVCNCYHLNYWVVRNWDFMFVQLWVWIVLHLNLNANADLLLKQHLYSAYLNKAFCILRGNSAHIYVSLCTLQPKKAMHSQRMSESFCHTDCDVKMAICRLFWLRLYRWKSDCLQSWFYKNGSGMSQKLDLILNWNQGCYTNILQTEKPGLKNINLCSFQQQGLLCLC